MLQIQIYTSADKIVQKRHLNDLVSPIIILCSHTDVQQRAVHGCSPSHIVHHQVRINNRYTCSIVAVSSLPQKTEKKKAWVALTAVNYNRQEYSQCDMSFHNLWWTSDNACVCVCVCVWRRGGEGRGSHRCRASSQIGSAFSPGPLRWQPTVGALIPRNPSPAH
jgi:hypothetical protein